MAITSRTGEFHKLREDFNRMAASPEGLSNERIESHLRDKDVDPEEFKSAWKEFSAAGMKADSPGFALGRIPGRAIGDTVEGVIDIGAAITPQFIEDAVEKVADTVGAKIPDSVKRVSAELFDPYHGDGLIEPVVGELASLLIPYTGIMKGYKYAKKGLGVIDKPKKIAKIKRTSPVKGWARKERLKRRGKGIIRESLGIGGAMTVVYGPEEDQLTELIEQFPETFDIVKGLAINPDDPELLQMLQAFRNNLVAEAPFAGAFGLGAVGMHTLGPAARRMNLSKTFVQSTKLSRLHQWARRNMTSRYGVDDKMLAMGLRRIYAGNKAVSEADGLSQDLMKTVKTEAKAAGVTPTDVEELMNLALMGEGRGIQELTDKGFTNTVDLIGQMRVKIDDLSEALTAENGLVQGELKATIDARKGMYINRAYRLFDDPSFKGWDELPQDTKEGAMSYLGRFGVHGDEAEWVLKEILSRGDSKNSFKQGMRLLADMSQQSNKPFLPRGNIPYEIKELMGEIKDPYKNFARTYEKLSIAKAEGDFIQDVHKHLIDQNLAVVGETLEDTVVAGVRSQADAVQGLRGPPMAAAPSYRLPAGTTDKALVSLKDITNERLQRIIGKSAVNRGDGVNPLKNLFVNKNYYHFLEEGIETLAPTSPLAKAFMTFKAGTQTSKTVLSPATHARNFMGNIVLMVANGYRPFTTSKEKNPLAIAGKRLFNRSDEDFGKYIGRLQELGIVDSSVRAQTVKKIASEAFNWEPGSHMEQIGRTKVGKGVRKTFELYQAEDDIFKIMHFQKTMDDMRKWGMDLSDEALEEMAATRTRDLMPNYALVPKAVKWLRRMPLSDFAAWPAELTRVSKNLLTHTYDDVTGRTARKLRDQGYTISDDGATAIRNQGFRRAGGLTAAGIAGDTLMHYSMAAAGLGKEDVNNINKLSPSWSHNTAKIFLGPIDQDENGHVGINFVNLGPIDPFSYLKAPARLLVSHLKSGKVLEPVDVQKFATAMYDNIAGPFLGSSMATEALMNIAGETLTKEGQEAAAKDMGGYAWRMATEVADVLEPGAIQLVRKQIEYQKSKAKGDEVGRGAMSEFGYTMPKVEFDLTGSGWLRMIGIRPQRLDISAGMRRNLLPLIKEIDNASAKFTAAVSNPQGVTKPELMDAYKDAVKGQINDYKRFKNMTEIYDSLLKDSNLSNTDIRDKLEAIHRGVTKDYGLEMNPKLFGLMHEVRENRYQPFYPSKRASAISQLSSKNEIPWDDIHKLYLALSGSKITDE